MIDLFIYSFFGKIDKLFSKVEQVFTFDFPKSKKNKKDFPIE
jgi:hypothetical protein